MLALKVFINDKPMGYVDREHFATNPNRHEAFTLDDSDNKEAFRLAKRFEDGYDADDEWWLTCKVVKWDIVESEVM